MSGRVRYLDGLRGFGSVQVLLLHILTMIFPFIAASHIGGDSLQKLIIDTPVQFICDGSLAVFIFFLISGYVLSQAYKSKMDSRMALIASRYIRLALPCFASAILVVGLAAIFFNYVGCDKNYCSETFLSLRNVVQDIFFQTLLVGYGDSSVFFTIPFLHQFVAAAGSGVNPVLWTISIELWGSILTILLCSIEQRFSSKTAFWVALMAGICLFRSYYLTFILGYFLNRYPMSIAKTIQDQLYMFSFIVIGICFGIMAQYDAFRFIDVIANIPLGPPAQSAVSLQLMIAAILIVIGVIRLRSIQILLETPFFQFLGLYSFPLYLVHYPIIRYVGLYIARHPVTGMRDPVLYPVLASMICIMLSFIVAGYFLYIDAASVKIGHWVNKHLLSWNGVRLPEKRRI
jgi:peptidoglycan/LPS O-acetylase OafA/YrhL